jgi:hypothetical protein
MICKFKDDIQYSDHIKIDYDQITTSVIYCLYHITYDIGIDFDIVEKADTIIAYSDSRDEVIKYRNELIEIENLSALNLYIKNIPNIVSYNANKIDKDR